MPAPQSEFASHFKFLKALREFLSGQTMQGLAPDTGFVIKKHAFKRDGNYSAGCYVTPYTERVRPRGSAGDWFGWGAAVTCIVKTNQELSDEEQINTMMLWRQKAYDCLLPMTDTVLPGCEDFLSNIEIEPGVMFDVTAFACMFDLSQLIVWGSGVRNRGTNQYS